MYYINFETISYNMFLSNPIEGFLDHQYLLKETINALDFLHRDSYQRKIACKIQETNKMICKFIVAHGYV